MRTVASWIALVLVGTAWATSAAAQDPTVRYSFKTTALASRLPDAPALFADRDSASGLARLRIEPTVRWGDAAGVECAVEERFQAFTTASGAIGGFVLPSTAPAPYRVAQLDWAVATGANGAAWIEIDRAAAHLHRSRADVTIGRQAIGWGRGAVFGAVDLFSPFTPLEVDREWRRGVDAVRADLKLTDRASVDTVAAFGETIGASAFGARLRGYGGRADVELVGGYRARDGFAGMTSSAPVGDVEVHGEIALFRTPASPGSLAFGVPRTIAKGVAGASYRIPAAHGIVTYVEYHYSGFGAPSAAAIPANLRDPEFLKRYLRGDTQILARHAIAAAASYEWSPQLALSTNWVLNPADGSGVIVPSVTWLGSDRWSVMVNGYVPYGEPPTGPVLRSEYGISPLAALVQFRVYR